MLTLMLTQHEGEKMFKSKDFDLLVALKEKTTKLTRNKNLFSKTHLEIKLMLV